MDSNKNTSPSKLPENYRRKLLPSLLFCTIIVLLFWSFNSTTTTYVPTTPSNFHMLHTKFLKEYNHTYHNTLIVDTILPEDFIKFQNFTQINSIQLSIREQFIVNEISYNRTRSNHLKTFQNLNCTTCQLAEEVLQVFSCPYTQERLGDIKHYGIWVCGFELFEKDPRPQECVIYMIQDKPSESSEYILETLENRTDCHILYFYNDPKHNAIFSSDSRIQVFKEIILSDSNSDEKVTLKMLMRQHEHAWIDILFLDIPGREINLLLNNTQEFKQMVPVGQLYVSVYLNPSVPGNFTKWRDLMETRGLRPFHIDVREETNSSETSIVVANYGFLNLRGKHLLLNGDIWAS